MTARLALASLFIVAAVLARPWQTNTERWVLGVSVAAVVLLLAWWGGLFLTTRVARRIGMWWRNIGKNKPAEQPADSETVVLRVDPADPAQLPVVVSYLDRYGIRCDKVRVTHRDAGGTRRSWISLTVAATDNLDALRARSSRIPLRDTTEIVGRRLADHLREQGWTVTPVDGVDSPLPDPGKETWRAVKDDSGYVAAYRVTVSDKLQTVLAAIGSLPAQETWMALEFTGSPVDPQLTVGAAFRMADRPSRKAPLAGLTPACGRHRPALAALNPLSSDRLDGTPAAPPQALLKRPSVEHEIPQEAGHPA
ncbi:MULTISPECIES: type VII secretion protein EccE [unclassified Mycolicibacterium]|uniref:type VII secretion protein EccE n=1 Tax=unclassified Mycolicibacterium TaxID=2636767 RepID=UPI0012DF4CBC|nr:MULTISPECIES: type VII secretion protein EccE [unclassified Mycolicibacterium]MUL82091.1 type VII secretion protein EccE [Mycolicibacterium sp. CBMA 329]MUL87857.1 type VII secretion protein EccE [Mycolicibacterium sp. CBMA 331]MUM01680.1 type VII secretion protein EccE [Mycolicibacterium sp. CBMA 334]MUM28416.1 type VII secretion protein EccE [Mycolicibacterium sp. CBMA 295]MUM38154.1 type VII secretion protein EccE [Mycolicibacterium sp. CBMA 247]